MENLGNWFAKHGMIIVYVLIGILVVIFLPWILKIIKYVGKGLLFILKFLWKVLSWPFKAIAKAVSKKKGE